MRFLLDPVGSEGYSGDILLVILLWHLGAGLVGYRSGIICSKLEFRSGNTMVVRRNVLLN